MTLRSPSALECTIRPHSAGIVEAMALNTDNSTNPIPRPTFTYLVAPIITALSPTHMSRANGGALLITGTGFIFDDEVTVNGRACITKRFVSGGWECNVPTANTGTTGAVQVSNSRVGHSTSRNSLVFDARVYSVRKCLNTRFGNVQGCNGAMVFRGGMNGSTDPDVAKSGCNSAQTAVTSTKCCTYHTLNGGKWFLFDDIAKDGSTACDQDASGNSIECLNAGSCYAYSQPGVDSAQPTSTTNLNGGVTITVYGQNFLPGLTIAIDGTACASPAITEPYRASATCIIPAHAAGEVSITVTNPDDLSGTKADVFRYLGQPPAISSVTLDPSDPAQGPVSGGTAILINGIGFVMPATDGTGGSAVRIGSSACTQVTVQSTRRIRCITPNSYSTGPVEVKMTNPDGQSVSRTGGFTYTDLTGSYHRVFVSSSVTKGGAMGGWMGADHMCRQLAINGGKSGIWKAILSIGALDSTARVEAIRRLEIGGPVYTIDNRTIANDETDFWDGTHSAPIDRDQLNNPRNTLVWTGTDASGLTTASNFGVLCSNWTILGGNNTARTGQCSDINSSWVSNTEVGCTMDAALYCISQPALQINSIAPNTAFTDGTISSTNRIVTISGTGIDINATVFIGGSLCAPVVFDNSKSIRCEIPAHAAGTVDVVATNPSSHQIFTLPQAFTYTLKPPAIDSISPTHGPSSGPTVTTLIIAGRNFTSDAQVSIGTQNCPVTSPAGPANAYAQIQCAVPKQSPGEYTVSVTISDGNVATAATRFKYHLPCDGLQLLGINVAEYTGSCGARADSSSFDIAVAYNHDMTNDCRCSVWASSVLMDNTTTPSAKILDIPLTYTGGNYHHVTFSPLNTAISSYFGFYCEAQGVPIVPSDPQNPPAGFPRREFSMLYTRVPCLAACAYIGKPDICQQ
jgi:hypothetical protein